MRIALWVHCFFPDHFYGTEAYTLSLAKGLLTRGHDVTVVSATFAGEPRQNDAIEARVFDGVPILSIDKNLWPPRDVGETWDQPAMRAVQGEIVDRLKPDLAHVCHVANHTRALLEVLAERKIPTVATLTDFFAFCYTNRLEAEDGSLCPGPTASRAGCIACHLGAAAPRPDASRLARLAGGAMRRPAAVLLALGTRLLGDRLRVDGFRPNDIVRRPQALLDAWNACCAAAIAPTDVLRTAYEANGFRPEIRLSHFGVAIDRRRKPTRPPDRVRLGYIGQIAPHKGIHLAVEALAEVGSPILDLTIWGAPTQDPAYTARLEAMAADLPVAFAGTFPVERMADVMASIDVLVIPSTWPENSPLVLLQALATHTPVIVADVAGLTEFVTVDVNGMVFARGDARSLASVLRRLVARPALAAELSSTTDYTRTPEDMIDEVAALHAEVMARRA